MSLPLLLEGGDEIDLSGRSFTMKRDQALIKNDADNLLSYEAEGGTDKAKIVHNRLIIPERKNVQTGVGGWHESMAELRNGTHIRAGLPEPRGK